MLQPACSPKTKAGQKPLASTKSAGAASRYGHFSPAEVLVLHISTYGPHSTVYTKEAAIREVTPVSVELLSN